MWLQRPRKRIEYIISKLSQAEQSGNSEVLQVAYEELFFLCYRNCLDLKAVLTGTRGRLTGDETGQRSNSSLGSIWRGAYVARG